MTSKLGRWAVTTSLVALAALTSPALAADSVHYSISDFGAIGDGSAMNTKAIQATIDQCAAKGGTVIIPKGEFLTGALFLKPGVNMELQEGAILKGSKNIEDFPILKNERFEGHFQDHVTALLNVIKCDHFHLTGPGMIDGNGDLYWTMNTPQGRPRLCAIRDSSGVEITGVKFMSSPTWNLHLYNCSDSLVENCRFEIADTAKGPSTDGTDIDSCQDITVKGCYYSVNDDCICLKGNRYDGLDQDPKSPPVKNVHVLNCTFARGMGALTLGTEATIIRDVEMEHCTVAGNMPLLRLKLRPDTPGQDYSNIHVHDIQLNGRGAIISVEPQHGTKVPMPAVPFSKISAITMEKITGSFGSFGKLAGGPTTTISGITLRDIDVRISGSTALSADGVADLKMENVIINAAPAAAPAGHAVTTRP